MRNLRTRRTLGVVLGVLALGALAGPVAAAGSPEQWSSTDTRVIQHDCGVVETTTGTIRVKAFFENGQWLRDVVQFNFVGVYVGPTGKSFTSESHQTGIFTPETGSLTGQGTFVRSAGGPIQIDVGRLVFQASDGETLMSSAKALSFGDPDAAAALEAALCAKLG